MTIYQQVQELRAELGNCNNAEECRQIESELATAKRALAAQDDAFEAWLKALE
ncbi:hypothetical protein ACFO8O_13525 [Hephaestia sp. GCM10023244]|uniref:hypothetical protein n=1 Tax=unclassified Hephaestia TaxID=2631281 RepID=UPI0020777D46|nr:hypothetical protein [Hephaestia sp. MAHUQ-44]MCM8731980.1 hypothetical protein [Hephaestia sp. MAHUQ-44]